MIRKQGSVSNVPIRNATRLHQDISILNPEEVARKACNEATTRPNARENP
jgi:hypothetical protein